MLNAIILIVTLFFYFLLLLFVLWVTSWKFFKMALLPFSLGSFNNFFVTVDKNRFTGLGIFYFLTQLKLFKWQNFVVFRLNTIRTHVRLQRILHGEHHRVTLVWSENLRKSRQVVLCHTSRRYSLAVIYTHNHSVSSATVSRLLW